MKRIISALAVFAVLSCSLVNPAFAYDKLNGIETEIKNDFIPDHLQTDIQRNITRAEFCDTLVSLYEYLSKKQAELPAQNPFTDTASPEVLKAYQLGIVHGNGDGIFLPNNELNVEQKAVMLYNTLLLLDPSIDNDLSQETEGSHCDFNDASSVSVWAVEAIEYLYHHAIIYDDKNNNINAINSVAVGGANSDAKNILEHYNDLTTLTASKKDEVLKCSSKDNQVTMSDGSLKSINEIKTGDMILSMNNVTVRVNEIITGYDQQIVMIRCADDRIIKLTKSQPIMTSSGFKQTYHLYPSDELVDNNGNLIDIVYVYLVPYNDTVYQLLLDSPVDDDNQHTYISNGFIIGDIELQNNIIVRR